MRIDCFVTAAGLAAFVLCPGGAGAQQAKPNAGGPPAAAARPSPPGPYRQVSVSLPKPFGDPSLDALRRDIGDIAKRKDRAALTSKVVAKGFFGNARIVTVRTPRNRGSTISRRRSDSIALMARDGLPLQPTPSTLPPPRPPT